MPGRDIRTNFVLDGEAKYKTAMKSISTEMRLLDAELGKATVGFDKNADAMDILSATSLTLQKKMDVQKQKIEAVQKKLDESKKSYGENSDAAKGYAIELAYAETKLEKMKNELSSNDRQMEELKDSTNDAGNEVKQLGDKADAASTNIKSSDVNFAGFGSTLGNVVKVGAQAAAVAIAAVTTAAIAATKAVIDLASESGKWADEMLTLSVQTGISTQTLQEWDYAARFVDTEVETMTKGLRRVVKATGEAAEAGNDYIQIADGLTVSIYDSNGKLKDSEQLFYDSIDAINGMKSETEKEIATQELFGKSYQDMMPLIQAGSDGLNKYAEEAQKAGVVLDDGMIKKLGEYDDAMQKVDAKQDALKKSFVVNFIPALTAGADALTGVMDTASTALSDGFQPEDIKTIGGAVSDTILDMFENVSDVLPEVAEVFTDLIVEAVGIMADVLPTLLPVIIDAAFTLLQALLDAIVQNVVPISDMIVQLVTGMVKFIIANLPLLLQAALQIVIAVAQGLAAALPELIPAISAMMDQMVLIIVENLPLLIGAGLEILTAVIQGINDSWPDHIDAIMGIVKSITGVFIENLPMLTESGIELLFAVIDGLVQALPDMILYIPEIIEAIVDAFAEADWNSIGANLMSGIGEGIAKGVASLVDTAIKACEDLAQGVKDFFGIASPSKLFEGYGGYISEGMAVGIEGKSGMVTDAISSLTPPEINPKVSAELLSSSEIGGTVKKVIEHTGTIRFEGVNNEGQLMAAVEMFMGKVRRESMLAGSM